MNRIARQNLPKVLIFRAYAEQCKETGSVAAQFPAAFGNLLNASDSGTTVVFPAMQVKRVLERGVNANDSAQRRHGF